MFNLNQTDVRTFFFDVFEKSNSGVTLSDLEKIALSVIMEHPEYHQVLHNRQKYLDYVWTVEMGETNPFLHLSLHLSLIEQLSIDQPHGIAALYSELSNKLQDKHSASHELIDCLGEMLWQAQRNNQAPDVTVYFKCINQKLGKE